VTGKGKQYAVRCVVADLLVGKNMKIKATGKMEAVTASNGHAGKLGGQWHHRDDLEYMPTKGSGPYHARFQQTMLRIKDPKASVPFYETHFGCKLIHWIAFPQWGFTVYFLIRPREGQSTPACTLEKTGLENEKYLNTMADAAIELTHNHGTETDDNYKPWNGNTGRDGDGELFAEEPAARGFGHIAFNCNDVYDACAKLEAAGVKFRKKPDEGRMKGLAFALDPDGYWVEIVRRQDLGWPEYYNYSQTMMRVKDGPATAEFYKKYFGMTILRQMDMPQWKFTNYFLASLEPEELVEAAKLDPDNSHTGGLNAAVPNGLTKVLWNCCLELTWNHGTEKDPNFQVHNGNDQPQGFGHIGFLVDNLEKACQEMEADGVKFKKKPQDGNMRGIAFAYDPNGYWIEMINRSSSFQGTCANY